MCIFAEVLLELHVSFLKISHLHTHEPVISLIVARVLRHQFTFSECSILLLELFNLALEYFSRVSQCSNLFSHLFSLVFVHSQELDVFLFGWSRFVPEMVLEGLSVSD